MMKKVMGAHWDEVAETEFLQKSLTKHPLGYVEMQHVYQSAIREIQTKLEILNDEFQLRYKRNPIHHMQSRLKSLQSIVEKLNRKGFPVSIESARKNLQDIAGIRVTCSYVDDIYMIAKLLIKQDDIELIRQMDYIQEPKSNGYRSLHLVVQVPVFFPDRKELVPVEIQIRTIAMDFWASLEHQLHYKGGESIPSSVKHELKRCADTIADTDLKMQNIYNDLLEIEREQEQTL